MSISSSDEATPHHSSVAFFPDRAAKLVHDIGQLFDMPGELLNVFVLLFFVFLQVVDELVEFLFAEFFAIAVIFIVAFMFLAVLFARQVAAFDVLGKFLCVFGNKVSRVAHSRCREMFGRNIEMLNGRVSVLDPITAFSPAFTARFFPLLTTPGGLFEFLNPGCEMLLKLLRLFALA